MTHALAFFLAWTIDIPPGATQVIVALLQVWIAYMLSKVHKLVNSNYAESVNAKVAAEVALKVSQEMNRHLQEQLDTLKLHTLVPPSSS